MDGWWNYWINSVCVILLRFKRFNQILALSKMFSIEELDDKFVQG